MAVFEASLNSGPVREATIESSITLSVSRMVPQAEISVLNITVVQESLHITGVVLAAVLPSRLGNPGKSYLVMVSVALKDLRRLR